MNAVMVSRLLATLVALIVLIALFATQREAAASITPKILQTAPGSFSLGTNSRVTGSSFEDELALHFTQLLQNALERKGTQGSITTISILKVKNPLQSEGITDPDIVSQGYRIRTFNETLILEAAEPRGVIHGINYLRFLIRGNKHRHISHLVDWPSISNRGIHVVLGFNRRNDQRFAEIKDVMAQIRLAALYNMNFVIFQLANSVNLPRSPVVRNGALSKKEFVTLVNYARKFGLGVVIELKLLTHQEKLLANKYPELMYNHRTYDPRNPGVYDLLFPYLDEIIHTTSPCAILIGHDEVFGFKKKHKFLDGETILPASLFLQDVKILHQYLKDKVPEIWMWGDMLITSSEFPSMLARHLHGNAAPEYGAPLRKLIPKDIVILDWHYFDQQESFPSLARFREEGFRTYGATYDKPATIKNFSKYAVRHRANGMIATLWTSSKSALLTKGSRIIMMSGVNFWGEPDIDGRNISIQE